MKRLFFLILLFLPLSAFADFNVCDQDSTWYVCGDFQALDANILNETEISDSTTATGESTQTNETEHTNEGFEGFSLAMNTPHEVGWRS